MRFIWFLKLLAWIITAFIYKWINSIDNPNVTIVKHISSTGRSGHMFLFLVHYFLLITNGRLISKVFSIGNLHKCQQIGQTKTRSLKTRKSFIWIIIMNEFEINIEEKKKIISKYWFIHASKIHQFCRCSFKNQLKYLFKFFLFDWHKYWKRSYLSCGLSFKRLSQLADDNFISKK